MLWPVRWLAVVLALVATPALAELRLVMVQQPGCVYCAEWDAAIAPIYDKTPEGRAAPLDRVQLRDLTPDTPGYAMPVVLTPTFVLMKDGQEQGRIEGYPGEDFFWGLLGRMLDETEQDNGEGNG